MVADVGFKKQLWALDPELDVVWDWGGCKWEIWRFPGQAKKKVKLITQDCHHLMTVQTKDRSFRELGADILLKLQAGDTEKYGVDQLANYFDQMDRNIQRSRARAFRNYVESITLESIDYLRGVVKRSVPFNYNVKPSEEKLLLNVKPLKTNRYLIEIPKEQRVARAIGGL
jgi:hypothetical protein